ncbi:hypothetical protein B0H11DRAFT_17978 [Mycena galericulata]|nr:hypothetical protein B0H11DRAFT_17978 [Mycena galericulata]
MSVCIDPDVFAQILSHVPDSKTVYTVLSALPKSHVFFPHALLRLCQLPIYLDTYDPRAASASNQVLDYLLNPGSVDSWSLGIAGSIRNLVVSVEHNKYLWPPRPPIVEGEEEHMGAADGIQDEDHMFDSDESDTSSGSDSDVPHEAGYEVFTVDSDKGQAEGDVDVVAFHERLPKLFGKTRNLESIDYHNIPGLGLSAEAMELLGSCERLRAFSVDTVMRRMTWNSYDDPETWNIELLVSPLGSSITSLDLRHICQTTFLVLASYKEVFATYQHLSRLKMDITEGVWDWDYRGSPQLGASADYVFPSLGFPAVRRFELVVADLTISTPRTGSGPLDLVDCTLLSELSLEVHQSIGFWYNTNIHLFETLSPSNFSALTHLEIKDTNSTANRIRLRWSGAGLRSYESEHTGRYFVGLVPSFLGLLANLVSLWVDEKALLPANGEGVGWERKYTFCSVRALWDSNDGEFDAAVKTPWVAALQDILSRLESLRVGFGRMNHTEVEHVLSCCDPEKLRQFGFEWAWHEYGRDQPISSALLATLARFPRLTDVHILFPRPGTQVSGAPNPAIGSRTLNDVASIFACNGNICRVGIGNSVVWERHGLSDAGNGIILVSDGSSAPNAAVSGFYHAGYMAKYRSKSERPEVHDDNTTPLRPKRGAEIEQLRDLLKRILE